jgi:hypothetical protein
MAQFAENIKKLTGKDFSDGEKRNDLAGRLAQHFTNLNIHTQMMLPYLSRTSDLVRRSD